MTTTIYCWLDFIVHHKQIIYALLPMFSNVISGSVCCQLSCDLLIFAVGIL